MGAQKKILNFGSLNLDHVYSLDHIVQPKETIDSTSLDLIPGGKGLNQSVALAKAGAEVYHAGMVGEDGGQVLIDTCRNNGVNTEYIQTVPGQSGHTVIQVDRNGQNSIILFGGANRKITKDYVDQVLGNFDRGDIVLLQDEINELPYIIDKVFSKGMTIALNPSPFNENIMACDLSKISIFILNEVEGSQLTGSSDPEIILKEMRSMFPDAKILLTLGENGSIYCDRNETIRQEIYHVKAVDTTAAGDTFTGYFLAGIVHELSVKDAMDLAAKASALAVTKKGAAVSIPWIRDVMDAKF